MRAGPTPSEGPKQQNLHLFLRTIGEGRVEPLNQPLHLFLEITSRCNLRCAKCGMNYDEERQKGQSIPLDFLAGLAPLYGTAIGVNTFGYGEMFLYRGLPELVTLLKAHDCRLYGITNGTQITAEDFRWLVAQRFDSLTFSIDGAEPETMRRLRGAELDGVLGAIRGIQAEKSRQGAHLPQIVINFVAQNDNFHELPGLARIAADLAVDYVGVNTLHHSARQDNAYGRFYDEFRLGLADRARFGGAIAEARAILSAAGVEFHSHVDENLEWESSDPVAAATDPVPPARPNPGLRPYYCVYPWMSLYLAADHTTKVCCFMNAKESMGEFRDAEDVGRIWRGERMQAVRNRIRAGEVHDACRVCVERGRFASGRLVLAELARHALGDAAPVDHTLARVLGDSDAASCERPTPASSSSPG